MKRRANLTAAEKSEIERLRGLRWKVSAIATAIPCSPGSVSWHLLMIGWPRIGPLGKTGGDRKRPPVSMRKGKPVRAFTPEEDARITRLRIDGKSPYIIARLVGRRHNSIVGRLAALARMEEEREAA